MTLRALSRYPLLADQGTTMNALRLAVSLICLLAVAGCKKDQSATGKPAAAAMGSYAEGYNKLLESVKSLISRYDAAFPDGPSDQLLTGARKPSLFPEQTSATRELKAARDSFATAKAAAPESLADVAALAEAMASAAEVTVTVYGEAQKYYDAENYKDDKLAKGKELHSKFIAAKQAYRSALAAMNGRLDKIEDEQALAELKEYEAEKGYSYWFRRFNIAAKQFVTASQKADSPEQFAALEAAWKPVDELHAELGKFVASKGAGVHSVFSSYVGAADRFDAAGRKLIRAIKEAKPDAGNAVQTGLESIVSYYNQLVSMVNSLYTLESNDQLK